MSATKTRVVVAGGGFGGAYAAQALEKKLGGEAEIVLVDRNNYFVFYPLLVEAGVGQLEPRHTVVALRAFLRRARFLMAELVDVDVAGRTLSVRRPGERNADTLPFDHLILALGSVTRLPEVPGLDRLGFQMKSLNDAVGLRDRAIQLLERADATPDPGRRAALLHFVVVGANFTGAEVAGEFDAFLKEASHAYENVSARECRVTLIEMADRILTALDPELSDYAVRRLRARGVDVRLQTTVREIREREVVLDSGETVASETVIWCAGIAPHPLLSRIGLPTDERGYLLCDPDLRVRGYEHVWAIGDCAANPDPEGKSYPATAQHAVRQASHVAENLARVARGQDPRPLAFRTLGSLAALGCRTGVARVLGIKVSGWPAWFLWRTVYLLKMPGWGRRLRVAIDWTLALFFRREYVTLGVRERAMAEPPARRDAGNEVDSGVEAAGERDT